MRESCPCRGCEHEPPELWPDNQTAWGLYQRFGTQVIPGFGGIYGFNLPSILSLADRCKIPVEEDDLNKLLYLEGLILEKQAEESERRGKDKGPLGK